MIDLRTESLLTLAQAAKIVPPGRGGKQTHISTLFRWLTHGARSPSGEQVRLEGVRLGGRWMTSREALQRFAEALTPDLAGKVGSMPRSPSRAARDAERAGHELEALGI